MKKRKHLSRMTPDDIEVLRRDYAAGVEVKDIARKLGRSWGVIRQKVHALGLHRNSGVTRALRYAPDELKARRAEMTDREFTAAAKEWRRGRTARAKAARDEIVRNKVEAIAEAGGPRRAQMASMRDAGATLEAIGNRFGLTRERVRQITDPMYLERLGLLRERRMAVNGAPIVTIMRHWNRMMPSHREAFLKAIGARLEDREETVMWS